MASSSLLSCFLTSASTCNSPNEPLRDGSAPRDSDPVALRIGALDADTESLRFCACTGTLADGLLPEASALAAPPRGKASSCTACICQDERFVATLAVICPCTLGGVLDRRAVLHVDSTMGSSQGELVGR